MTLDVTIDDAGLLSHLRVAPQIVAYFGAKAVGSMFAKARKVLIAKHRSGLAPLIKRTLFYTGWPPGGQEHIVLHIADPSVLARMRTEWFTTSPVTKIHETGGTIRPQKAGALFIPLGKAKAARAAKRSATRLADLGPTADTFVIRNAKGAFVFRRDAAHREAPELVGLLRDEVTIKPRLGFYRNWQELEADRAKRLEDAGAKTAAALATGRSPDALANSLLATAFKRERKAYEGAKASSSLGAL